MTKATVTRKRGRPPAGDHGKPSSEYPQLSVRVPPETKRQCALLARRLGLAQWQVVRNAMEAYYRSEAEPPA